MRIAPYTRNVLAVGSLLVFQAASDARAQLRPDAGIIQREQERLRPPGLVPTPRPAPLTEEPARPAPEVPATRTFPVKGFRITGNTVFSEAQILPLLEGFAGRDLSLQDLEKAADSISRFYRINDYFLARAYVPAQDLKDGIVEITVLEGRVEGLRLKLAEGTRLSERVVEQTLREALPSGVPLKLSELERGLLLLKDLPSVEARSVLLPGSALGTTIASVEVSEGPLIAGSLDFDNFGSKFSGALRIGASVLLNDPSGSGDQVSFRASLSSGTSHARLAYQVPVGATGLKLGAGYAETRYRLCCEFASLEATGQARSANFNAFYPLVRGRAFNLYGTAAIDSRHYFNSTIAGTTSDKTARLGTLGLNGDGNDALGGGGLNSFGVGVSAGRLDLDGWAPDRAADAATARTHGSYRKLTFAMARLQRLRGATSLYAGLSGQFASKNLDSSEKFLLGGPHGVRGYPTAEAAGDEGVLLNLEVRYDLLPTLQLAGFIDHGEVRLHAREWGGWQGGNNRITNRYGLASAGIGVNWGLPRDVVLRASVARPLGSNAGQDANGNNSDNQGNQWRLWLQAVKIL
jgi:hemolysin activation/secretion protein